VPVLPLAEAVLKQEHELLTRHPAAAHPVQAVHPNPKVVTPRPVVPAPVMVPTAGQHVSGPLAAALDSALQTFHVVTITVRPQTVTGKVTTEANASKILAR